jgi:hypothetical protein
VSDAMPWWAKLGDVDAAAPWRVSFSPRDEDRVVRVHLGNAIAFLPALEAHKLGSALHAASGIDTSELIVHVDEDETDGGSHG